MIEKYSQTHAAIAMPPKLAALLEELRKDRAALEDLEPDVDDKDVGDMSEIRQVHRIA